MLTVTATFDVTMLYFVAANVVAILIYVLVRKGRAGGARRNLDAITAAVVDFFRSSGEQVTVECVSEPDGKHFVALIDSLPSKRLRHSHIVAVILGNHVRKACGLELDRVYWRFPIKAAREDSSAESLAAECVGLAGGGDEYSDEGESRLKDLPRYEVTESSWEQFRELVGRKTVAA